MQKDADKVSFPALRIFLAGAISGGIAKTAVAPFDRYALLFLPTHTRTHICFHRMQRESAWWVADIVCMDGRLSNTREFLGLTCPHF
jgi:hypothetical protein